MSTAPMIEVNEDVLGGASHPRHARPGDRIFMSSIWTAAEAAQNEQAACTRAG